MSLRCASSSFVLLALAACHVAPSASPQPSPELAQMRAEFDLQLRLLTNLCCQRAADPLGAPPESAGTTEIAGRLATLNERLDELVARLSAPPAGSAAADASSARRDPGLAMAANDSAGIELLGQALRVNEQMRNAILENIANVNSAGWKRRQVDVTTTLHPASGLQVPAIARIQPVFTTGTLEVTERLLDIAIDGDGFFVVKRPDGTTAYTRDGGFHIDAAGRMVTGSGSTLLPEITVPDDTLEVSIDPVGHVTARRASSPDAATSLGEITLARFVDPHALRPGTGNTMTWPDDAGAPICGRPCTVGMGALKQGFIERSNVQIVDELVNLQIVERQRTVLRRVLAGYGMYVR